jgi:hypothetical protein
VEAQRFPSGWVTFAGVIAAIVAIWNILSGIAAISNDHQTETLNERRVRHRVNAGAETALDQARGHGWTVISVRNDWSTVFPEHPGSTAASPSPADRR